MGSEIILSKRRVLIGRTLGALIVLFLAVDGGMKVAKAQVVIETMAQLGYPESSIVGIGSVLLLSTALYVIPRTALIGAVLLTGYLGGAVATHVRVGAPVSNLVFPILCGILLWVALYLRDGRLQQIKMGS